MHGVTPGRRYADSEVARLHPNRRPEPFEPYGIHAAAPGQGKPLARRSPDGTRWCPFCQTPLAGQARACDDCRDIRRSAVADRSRNRNRVAENYRRETVEELLAAVDDLILQVGRASAQVNRGTLLYGSRQMQAWADALNRTEAAAEAIREANAGGTT